MWIDALLEAFLTFSYCITYCYTEYMNHKHLMSHSLWLMTATLVAFILARWLGALYDAEILAVLFIIYVFARRMHASQAHVDAINQTQILDASICTVIILTVVLTTGGLSSIYFFLMYFLLFGIALLVEPLASLVVTVMILALFIPDLPSSFNLENIIPLVSLPLMVPFALYVGASYRKREELQEQAQSAQKETQYIEEDALIFISTVVRTHVVSILELAENTPGDEKMTDIRVSAHRLQKLIDKFERMYQ